MHKESAFVVIDDGAGGLAVDLTNEGVIAELRCHISTPALNFWIFGINTIDSEVQVPNATAAAAIKTLIDGSVFIRKTNGNTNKHSIAMIEIARMK